MVLDLIHVRLFRLDVSCSVHLDDKKDTLILGKGPTPRLNDITSTAESEFPRNFINSLEKTFC